MADTLSFPQRVWRCGRVSVSLTFVASRFTHRVSHYTPTITLVSSIIHPQFHALLQWRPCVLCFTSSASSSSTCGSSSSRKHARQHTHHLPVRFGVIFFLLTLYRIQHSTQHSSRSAFPLRHTNSSRK